MNLKAQAHHLKPIVSVGKNGITENLLKEIDAALNTHELIKIKFLESALELMENLTFVQDLKAELVNTQGHIVTLHRKNPKKPRAK
ncbi:MAG: YhbY family RNA-binding protein [Myxococcota bacterium]